MYLEEIIDNLKPAYKKHNFSSLNFNSRQCTNGCVFFSIKGKKHNGNNFIKEAIKNGAKTIISDKKKEGYTNSILYLHSKNPRSLMAHAATKFYRNKPNNLVAVTGTNGKSSIVNFYYQILRLNKLKCSTIGTLGVSSDSINFETNNTTPNSILLNKTLSRLKHAKIDNVILEASSHGLDQKRLDGLKFDIAIFSNFTRDHLDYHKSFKNYFNAKMILFERLLKKKGLVIFDKDIKQSKKILSIIKNKGFDFLSIGNNSTINLIRHKYIKNYQVVEFKFKNENYLLKTKLIGKIQLKNLFMAILAASKFIPFDKIINKINKIKPINGRLQNIGNIKNHSKVILDYSHTPDALRSCITSIQDQFKTSKINIIFGCGGERDKQKRVQMGSIVNDLCNKIYLTDDNPRGENPIKIREQVKKKIKKNKLIEIPSREKAIKIAIQNLLSGEILIVAGKGHENYQEYRTKKHFSDKFFINKYIKIKNTQLSNYWKTNIINEYLSKKKISSLLNIKSVTTNSKEIGKNQIFVGLRGKNRDGNLFAEDAIKNKAIISLVNNYNKSKNSNIVKVKNSLTSFSKLSSNIRKVSNINSITITGSAGKTSFKDLLGKTLSKLSSTFYSKNSFNNKFGVPISLFNINQKNNFGVFEVGMDKKGEIGSLSSLTMPNTGIITNISYAHIKNFKSLAEIASAKGELIDKIIKGGTLILNKDDKFYRYFKKKALRKNLKVISFSKMSKSDIRFIKTKKINNKLKASFLVNSKIFNFNIHHTLEPYIENLSGVIAVLSIYFNLDKLDKNIFLDFRPTKGRGNIATINISKNKVKLIDESYNSNPLSLKFSIEKFSSMDSNNQKKIVLLGDMLELGKFSKRLHMEVPKIINKSDIDKVYVFGNFMKQAFNKIKTQKQGKIFETKKEINDFINTEIKENVHLMIKGSNSTGLNKIIKKYI